MTDGPDQIRRKAEGETENTVAALASRAVAVLAERRLKARAPLSERLLQGLIDAALKKGNAGVDAAIADILHSGSPPEEAIDFYIPEAARRLGEGWCSDSLGFAEVTIATARLQHAVRELSHDPRSKGTKSSGQSILVVVPEDEHHTLGSLVMTEQLRRVGFSVRLSLGEPNRRILQAVASKQYDAIFLSISASERLAQLRDLVEKSRDLLPEDVPIVVGGALGETDTEIQRITGADFGCKEVYEAIQKCGLTISPNGASLRAKTE